MDKSENDFYVEAVHVAFFPHSNPVKLITIMTTVVAAHE